MYVKFFTLYVRFFSQRLFCSDVNNNREIACTYKFCGIIRKSVVGLESIGAVGIDEEYVGCVLLTSCIPVHVSTT